MVREGFIDFSSLLACKPWALIGKDRQGLGLKLKPAASFVGNASMQIITGSVCWHALRQELHKFTCRVCVFTCVWYVHSYVYTCG